MDTVSYRLSVSHLGCSLGLHGYTGPGWAGSGSRSRGLGWVWKVDLGLPAGSNVYGCPAPFALLPT